MLLTTRHLFIALSSPLLALAFANVHASAQCTHYVNGSTGNDGNTGTQAAPFLTLQGADNYLYNSLPNHTTNKHQVTVCVAAGTYATTDYATLLANENNTNISNNQPLSNSGGADTLDINISGTSQYPITFEPLNGAFVQIIQTGWDAIRIYSNVKYLTITGFHIQSAWSTNFAALSDYNLATQRFANTNSPPYWPYYDGNCIFIQGDAVNSVAPAAGQTSVSPTQSQLTQIPSHILIQNNFVYGCGGGGIASSQADYITIQNNTVASCSQFSIFGTSGISLLDSVDSDTYTGTKNYVDNNYLYGNTELLPWVGYSPPQITDGEGIIIDTNSNSASISTQFVANGPYYNVNLPAYNARTLVANNVLWNNGSSAIEVFKSQHVDVESNSTYMNAQNQTETARGELSINFSSDVGVANNIFYGSIPFAANTGQELSGGWAYFDNNVYYAGGASIALPSSIDSHYFYEGNNEVEGNPLYHSVPTSSNTFAWNQLADMSVENDPGPGKTSAALNNGCTNSADPYGICSTPLTGVDGATRSASGYPSGAFVNTW